MHTPGAAGSSSGIGAISGRSGFVHPGEFTSGHGRSPLYTLAVSSGDLAAVSSGLCAVFSAGLFEVSSGVFCGVSSVLGTLAVSSAFGTLAVSSGFGTLAVSSGFGTLAVSSTFGGFGASSITVTVCWGGIGVSADIFAG